MITFGQSNRGDSLGLRDCREVAVVCAIPQSPQRIEISPGLFNA
jgi:hypothetical protein